MGFTLKEVQDELRRLGVSPKKSLGQNFLINPTAIERIISKVEELKPAKIVEVGPGLGALTELMGKMKVPLVVVELDREFAKMWRERGLDVVEDDALKIDWAGLKLPENSALISNLPYQISSSLVIDRSVDPAGIASMVLMFQKEVAARLLARAGTEQYGLLTVIAQNAWDVEKAFEISSKDFFPPPAVASQVVVFRRKEAKVSQKFLTFVKTAFAHRRKLLIKNISGLAESGVLEDVWVALRLNRQCRPEELNPKQFRELFEAVKARSGHAT